MSLSVIKVGGGLSGVPGALSLVCANLAELSRAHPVVIVPGGGPFADAVRRFQAQSGISMDAAHWMAILGMDQYAHVLAERIPGAVVADEPGELGEILYRGSVPVLAPYSWMRSADVLPHGWEVTSDSIAAFIAGALGADRLVLIKPAEGDDLLDPYFQTSLPQGLPYLALSWRRLHDLAPWLNGQSAAVEDRG